jgi:hypothetical protein
MVIQKLYTQRNDSLDHSLSADRQACDLENLLLTHEK